jgi:hypothetical protein
VRPQPAPALERLLQPAVEADAPPPSARVWPARAARPVMMSLQCSICSRSRARSSCICGLRLPSLRQLAGEDRHGRQRRAQFVRGAGGQRAQRHDPLVAQRLLARRRQLVVALRMAAAMRATSQAIRAAEATKISHMPARCRRVARAASDTGSGTYQNTSRNRRPRSGRRRPRRAAGSTTAAMAIEGR